MEPEKKTEKQPFIEREWTEDIEGKLDEDGFFITPNGSFWDQDYVYFNREGFDKHGGRYDENGEYVPGEGWDDNLNCYESEKENFDDEKEENEFDEGYTEEAMMKELAQFDDDDLFEGKDLIKEDPNIEKVIRHENEKEEKDDFMDEEKKDKKDEKNNDNNEDDLEDREDDEYEEIEDEEKEDTKGEKNKNKVDEKNTNVINIEKEKKSFFVKLNDGASFTINQDNNDNSKKVEIKNDIKENDNKFNKDGIEYEINKIDQKWSKKFNNKYYKDDYYYNDYNNKNNYKKKFNQNKNKNKKQYKNYNIFDDNEKK